VCRPVKIHRQLLPLPHSEGLLQSLPRTAYAPHLQPSVGPVSTTLPAPNGLKLACEQPSQPPIIEVLRRPLESAQYASRSYRERLTAAGILGSMSRKANPYDNAQAESFMKTLKHEEVLACNYETMQDVIDRIPRFIEEIYNRRRLHSALGYRPPEEFENTQSAYAA
jgi:hypothetical protein